MIENTTISVSSVEGDGSFSVELEQKPVNKGKVSRTDIVRMLAYVKSGKSARTYVQSDCSVEINDSDVTANLVVYVWPSNLNVPLETTSVLGEIGERKLIRMIREFDVVVDYDSSIPLPFLVDDCSLVWQTPCYVNGTIVEKQGLSLSGKNITISKKVFGVIRVLATAIGYAYPVAVTVNKENEKRITDLKPSFAARWGTGDGQNASISLDLPKCMTTLLDTCEDDILSWNKREKIKEPGKVVTTIYYSKCDGKVREIHSAQT